MANNGIELRFTTSTVNLEELKKKIKSGLGKIDITDNLNVVQKNIQLGEKIRKGIGTIDIGKNLTISVETSKTLRTNIQNVISAQKYSVDIGTVKLLSSAKKDLERQIKEMLGFNTQADAMKVIENAKKLQANYSSLDTIIKQLKTNFAAMTSAASKAGDTNVLKNYTQSYDKIFELISKADEKSLKMVRDQAIAETAKYESYVKQYNETVKLNQEQERAAKAAQKKAESEAKAVSYAEQQLRYVEAINRMNAAVRRVTDNNGKIKYEGMLDSDTWLDKAASEKQSYKDFTIGKTAVGDLDTRIERINILTAQMNEEFERANKSHKENEAAAKQHAAALQKIAEQYELTDRKLKDLTDNGDAYQKELATDAKTLKQIEQAQKDYNDAVEKSRQDVYGDIADVKAKAEAYAELVEKIKNAENATANFIAASRAMSNSYQDIFNYLQGNKRVADSSFGQVLRSYLSEMDNALKNGEVISEKRQASIAAGFNAIKTAADSTGLSTKKLSTVFIDLWAKLNVGSIVLRQIYRIPKLIRNMIEEVTAMDTAMTELRKVTNETAEGYNRFFDNAAERAKNLGATITDVISATADFARLGYNIEEASALSDAATIYKNVGDGINNINDAAESIISTMKAFKIETGDAISIVDKFNEVGNNFAISSSGIGESLIRSASALAAANNTLDESIALVTAMNSTVQNPEKVGNALKTLAAYLRSSSAELEELGETGEMIAITTPKLQEKMVALTHGAVQILERDGKTIRSTYDIMRDLSHIWDTGFLTDTEQAAILEMIAGKRQSSTVASLLQNFATAEEVLATAANSAGSAIAENEKYLDSINGKIAEFKAAFESLSATIISSDLVKGAYSFLTQTLHGIEAIVEATGSLPAAITAITTAGSLFLSQRGMFNSNYVDQYGQLHTSLERASAWVSGRIGGSGTPNSLKEIGMSFDQIVESMKTFNDQSLRVDKTFNQVVDSASNGNIALKNYYYTLGTDGIATMKDFTQYAQGMAYNAKDLTKHLAAAEIKTIALRTAMGALTGILISVVSSLAIKAWDNWIHRLDNAIEQTEKLNADWEDFDKTNKANIKSIEAISDEFKTLSQGIDKNGKNISLTEEQYSRYKDIVDQIVEISPTLVQGYNAEGQAIIDKNDAIEETIKLLKEQRRLELTENSAPTKMAERLQGNAAQYQKYENDLNSLRNAYGAAAAAFFNGGKGTVNFQTAADLVKQFGTFGINTANYFGRNGSNGFDGAAFAADFMDALAPRMSELAPEMFGYRNRTEMEQYYKNVVAAQIEINNQQQKMRDELDKMESSLSMAAQANTNWESLPVAMQDVVNSYIEDYVRDIRTLADTKFNGDYKITEEKVVEAEANIDKMIATMLDDRIRAAFEEVESLRGDFSSGKISSNEYKTRGAGMLRGYTNSGLSQYALVKLKVMLDLDNVEEETEQAVTEISQQVQDIMKTLEVDADGFAKAFDFSNAITSINDLGDSFSNLATALLKVQDGTMLTAQEINKLIAEYPDLVQAGDLYTAETIENQEAILKSFLDTKESQYKATIDEKIAELEAERSLLEQQITAEEQKSQTILELRRALNEGELQSQTDFQNALNELSKLEEDNFVKLQDGKITYNADALSKMLANDTEYGKKSYDQAWEPHAKDIAATLDAGYEAAAAELDNMLAAERTAIVHFSNQVLAEMSRDIKRSLRGEYTDTGGYGDLKTARNIYKSVTPTPKGTLIYNKSMVDKNISPDLVEKGLVDIVDAQYDELSKAFGDYLDAYERAVDIRTKAYRDEIAIIDNQIASLKSHKNIDLAKIYGTAPSSKSSGSSKDKSGSKSGSGSEKEAKTVEEYKADLDAYYAAEKKLAEIQYRRAQLEKQLADTTDLEEKIKIERELIKVYGEESEAQGEIKRLKEETIEQNVRALQQLGFEVEYNAATHQLYIDNQELLNEITADTKGDFETIEEATNDLRKTTEALIQSTEKLAGECGDASEAMYDLGKQTEESNKRIIEYLDEMVSKANEVVDGFEDIYHTFTQAAREYASTGFLSVDSLQAILQLGPKYLQLLYDEAGQLKINKERIQDIVRARTQEMGVQTAYAHVQKIIEALNNDDEESLRKLVQVTKDLTTNTWLSVYALAEQADALAKAKGKTDLFELSAVDQVRQMEAMTNTTISSLEEYWKSLEDGYVTQADALQDVIDQTIEYIKWENEQRTDALEKEKDDYKDLIESKKKMLELAKQEDKHNQDVEDKLREIAKLQRKIDQLSLDDSREAKAQKASLEEQLYSLQKELNNDAVEEGVSAAEDSLDQQYKAFEDEKDKEIDAIKKETQSYQKMWDFAIHELERDWDGMYQKIITWNENYGSSLNKDITSKWEQAIQAVQRYGSVVDALEGSKSDENIGVDQTPDYAIYEATIRQNVASMKANSIKWLTADPATRKKLEAENERLGAAAGLTKQNGAWYLPNGERAYKLTEAEYTAPLANAIVGHQAMLALPLTEEQKKKLLEQIEYLKQTLENMRAVNKYHTGGVVGDAGTIKQNEVMALLQKGETVLDPQKQAALYKLVDFATILQEKIGKVFDASMLSTLSRSATPTIPSSQLYASGAGGGFNFAPSVTVEINHSGELSENDARRYGNIAADAALEKLTDAFGRRGITNYSASLLKGAGA